MLTINLILLIFLFSGLLFSNLFELSFAQNSDNYIESENTNKIIIKNHSLIIEEYVSGLNWPTGLDFVGHDLFVTEKNSGNVLLIRDGKIIDNPILKIDVSTGKEEGVLGILTRDSTVYIHYTTRNLADDSTSNWYYSYYWNGEKLIEPKLLKQIDGGTEAHNSGPMIFYLDTVYAILGDLNNRQGKSQNYLVGDFDYSSSIFELEDENSLIAIGIRNSFGITVDPVTENLWITENGPEQMDEINLVYPKFNSGWSSIMGPSIGNQIIDLHDTEFVYSEPEFSWEKPVSPTAISFITSDKFSQFHNSVLVGDFNTGTLYEFKLNNERTGFVFKNRELTDLVLNMNDFSNEIVLATGFMGITDIQEGPDGLLYILSLGDGKIYRVKPSIKESALENSCELKLKPETNLSRCNLSGMNLQHIDLSDSNLSFSNLQNTNLKNSNLRGAILSGSDLRGAILSGSDLSYTDLSMSTLNEIIFNNVDLKNSNLRSTNFANSKISNSDFSNSDFDHINFENSLIENTIMNNVYLNRGNLDNSELKNVQLKHSYIDHTTFKNSTISDSDLSLSTIWVSDFNNSILHEVKFKKTDLYDTKFVNASIKKVNFSFSKIGNSFFNNSVFSNVNFLNVYPFETTFHNTQMVNVDLNSCLDHDSFSRLINRLLREIRDENFQFLSFLEFPLTKLCFN